MKIKHMLSVDSRKLLFIFHKIVSRINVQHPIALFSEIMNSLYSCLGLKLSLFFFNNQKNS